MNRVPRQDAFLGPGPSPGWAMHLPRAPRPALLVLRALLALAAGSAFAQEAPPTWRAGVAVAAGTHRVFPFDERVYRHDVWGYKLFFNRHLATTGPLGWEVQLEPSVYLDRHRLRDRSYLTPGWGPDYQAQAARYARGETVREYAFNTGIVLRWQPTRTLSLFILASFGPAYVDTETEHLASGLAFSDVAAVGVGLRLGRQLIELRPGLRHVSNGELRFPNGGYDGVTLDLSVSVVP